MKLFCDVVRCRSFSQAATLNGISQSAASQAVSQLEREAGAQFIDRTKRPFILTAEGEIFYAGLTDILHRHEAIEADIRSLRQDVSGLVRVAAIYSVGLHDMHSCMQAFMGKYPKARVRLQYLLPDRVCQAVLNEEVDLGIISYPTQTRDLAVIPLHSEPMVLVCHPEHHLVKRKGISLRQLQGENFIAFDRSLAICKELDRHLREQQVAVRKVMEFDNIETIKQAIEIGVGVSILPEPTVKKEVAAGVLVAIWIVDFRLDRPIGIIHRQRKTFAPVVKKFVEILQASTGPRPA
ncbi:MAG TPA: LysR family transcriptional regulator [Phycisphaerae bacterium]|nr:LysR family transcriptional regulator [Phycisphaerae bacterium]